MSQTPNDLADLKGTVEDARASQHPNLPALIVDAVIQIEFDSPDDRTDAIRRISAVIDRAVDAADV